MYISSVMYSSLFCLCLYSFLFHRGFLFSIIFRTFQPLMNEMTRRPVTACQDLDTFGPHSTYIPRPG